LSSSLQKPLVFDTNGIQNLRLPSSKAILSILSILIFKKLCFLKIRIERTYLLKELPAFERIERDVFLFKKTEVFERARF
jgi:hypothetical protein